MTSIANAAATIGSCSHPEWHHDDNPVCELCDREITPSCSAIQISTGHMESPQGERGFGICLDCAQLRAGFLESIAMLTAEVTDKWEVKTRPIREFRAARREAEDAFKEATAEHRKVLAAEIEELARQYTFDTGKQLDGWETHVDH